MGRKYAESIKTREGLLSMSSKIMQRSFLLQKVTARLSSTRIPSIINQPLVPEKRHKMTATPLSPKIYWIATYDSLFKYVLRTLFDRRVSMRLSPTLKSCHQPVSKTTWTTFKSCSCCSFVKDEHATNFLHEMCGHFGDIQKSFPKAKYDGTMKFVCKVDNDEYVMAQMEVMSENCWDMRALSYFASFYATSFAPRTTLMRRKLTLWFS